MALVDTKTLLSFAEENNMAIGAFNVSNMEMVLGAIKAAEEMKSPIILQIAEARLKHTPLDLFGPMLLAAAKKSTVNISVHLDHGLTLETIEKALNMGFTSVMFDGSHLTVEENILITRKVVEMAKPFKATVEAELGVVGGSEDDSEDIQMNVTDPQLVSNFLSRTGVNSLAVAIGNAHGKYAATPKLRLDILEEIRSKNYISLVLHGGSGITPEDFRKSIDRGIRKINIATASFEAYTQGSVAYISTTGHPEFFGLSSASIQGVCENVKRHIHIFNNRGELYELH